MSLLFTGCSNENEVVSDEIIGQQGKITFALPSSGSVTYATIANANENVLNDLHIYMFNGGQLEKIYHTGAAAADEAITLTGANNATTRAATIDVTNFSGPRTFYFVGNVGTIPADLTDTGKSAELTGVTIGMPEADFENLISDKQTALIMPSATNGLIMSAKQDVARILSVTPAEKEIHLKRRVARFDVSNVDDDQQLGNPTGTNFTIESILVSEANLNGYLFPAGAGKTIETGSLPEIVFTGLTGANTGSVQSVFYLYPTSLESGKTIISIKGKFTPPTGGAVEDRIYTIPVPATTAIDANYRYILKATRIAHNEIEWSLVIDPWDDGSEVEIGPGSSVFTLYGLTATGDGALDAANNSYDVTDATVVDDTLTFKTRSFDLRGTTAAITYMYNDQASFPVAVDNLIPTPVLTYADGAAYEQTYTIYLPQYTGNAPVKAVITVSDATNPGISQKVSIVSVPNFPSTSYKPVLFKGKYWAPVNVGASNKMDATTFDLAAMGYYYQWGRNYGAAPGTTGDMVAGPVTLANANGPFANNWIAVIRETSPNWLIVDGTITTQADANALWSPPNDQGPCPAGWRIPSSAELNLIRTAYTRDKFHDNSKVLLIPGDEAGQTLYIPASGTRDASGGFHIDGRALYYWSSTSDGNTNSRRLGIVPTTGATDLYNEVRAYGFPIRCIQK
ncbi:FISUMP domain-containing protein [Dysgonomonas reticulitermitis]